MDDQQHLAFSGFVSGFFSFLSTMFSTGAVCSSLILAPVSSTLDLPSSSSFSSRSSFTTSTGRMLCRMTGRKLVLAIFLSVCCQMMAMNRSSTCSPVLAEISKYGSPNRLAFSNPSSCATSLNSRSILLPTRKMKPSPTRCSLYSLIHPSISAKEALAVTSKTMSAQCASLRYPGMRLRKRSCPAVSHSWRRQFLALWVTFLARKSMPTVGCVSGRYVGSLLEAIVDVLVDDAGLPHALVPQEDHLQLRLPRHRAHRVVHFNLQILTHPQMEQLLDQSPILSDAEEALDSVEDEEESDQEEMFDSETFKGSFLQEMEKLCRPLKFQRRRHNIYQQEEDSSQQNILAFIEQEQEGVEVPLDFSSPPSAYILDFQADSSCTECGCGCHITYQPLKSSGELNPVKEQVPRKGGKGQPLEDRLFLNQKEGSRKEIQKNWTSLSLKQYKQRIKQKLQQKR